MGNKGGEGGPVLTAVKQIPCDGRNSEIPDEILLDFRGNQTLVSHPSWKCGIQHLIISHLPLGHGEMFHLPFKPSTMACFFFFLDFLTGI